jgi:hypothetical protein
MVDQLDLLKNLTFQESELPILKLCQSQLFPGFLVRRLRFCLLVNSLEADRLESIKWRLLKEDNQNL